MTDKSRVISANDLHVLMGQFLSAAHDIHVAMCLFDDDHVAQSNLNGAMHSALIGTGVCRQIHKSEKKRLAPLPTSEDE